MLRLLFFFSLWGGGEEKAEGGKDKIIQAADRDPLQTVENLI